MKKCEHKDISHSYKITTSGRLQDVLICEDCGEQDIEPPVSKKDVGAS